MEFIGQIKSISRDLATNNLDLSISTPQNILSEYDKIKDIEDLKITIVKNRKKRSLDANAYLWVLLQKMAEVLKTDKWTLYLKMLREYGKFTYIAVKPGVVDAVKVQWRETEEIGEIDINGQKAIQLLCYFGSSTYDTKEMAHLIDSVVSECKELDIDTLPPDELERMKSMWGVK